MIDSESLSSKALQANLYLPSKSLPLSSIRREGSPLFVQIQILSVFMAPPSPPSTKTCSIRLYKNRQWTGGYWNQVVWNQTWTL